MATKKPKPGPSRRPAHWYGPPASGMREPSSARISATMSWPTTAGIHSQIAAGPKFVIANPKLV